MTNYWTHPDAKIGSNVEIGPFSAIYENVEIGDDTWIGPNVTIFPGARIGKGCKIFPGAVIAAVPQDLKFQGEESLVEIGNNTTIRECATINRGTSASGVTKVGNNVLIMATAHIAHDCVIGDHVIIVNGVGIAGHVSIGDWTIIGGLSGIHQFVKIGKHVMISGGSFIGKDVPPYIKAAKSPVSFMGINSIGLRRRGFSTESIFDIQNIYKILYMDQNNTTQAIEIIETDCPATYERDVIINFIRGSERGIVKKFSV